jgi:hypothetical protein
MKTDIIYLFFVLAAFIIFTSGCIGQTPSLGSENVSVSDVFGEKPNVIITVISKPYDDHGLPSLNLTVEIKGKSEYPDGYYLAGYELWLKPEKGYSRQVYTILPGEMANGIENITIPLDGSYKTPVPGTYKIIVYEVIDNPHTLTQKREIYQTVLGNFSGQKLRVLGEPFINYEQINVIGPSAYAIYGVNMTIQNDGDLPVYPFLILSIDNEQAFSDAFTVGENYTQGSSALWARGIGPGETIAGSFSISDWRGKTGEGFAPGNHSVKYTLYNNIYNSNLNQYVTENISILTGSIVFIK